MVSYDYLMKLEQAQGIADLTAKFLGLANRPKIEFTTGQQTTWALAYTQENRITIPFEWFSKEKPLYMFYVIIHEITHFMPKCSRHTKTFLAHQEKALAFWNLKVIKWQEKKKFYAAIISYVKPTL